MLQINAENAGCEKRKVYSRGYRKRITEGISAAGRNQISVIVLDPPRSGCEKAVLKAINILAGAKDYIYVSCNPATQARDVKYLNECGYDLQVCCLLDMFPQTAAD